MLSKVAKVAKAATGRVRSKVEAHAVRLAPATAVHSTPGTAPFPPNTFTSTNLINGMLIKQEQQAFDLDLELSRAAVLTRPERSRHEDYRWSMKTPLLTPDVEMTAELQAAKRQEILDYFSQAYDAFEELHLTFNTPSAFYKKHEQLRHPPIFYMGHTAAFYVNKLNLGKFTDMRIDPTLEIQMAVGVDEMSWDDLDTNSYVWPSFDEAEADPRRAAAFLDRVIDFRRKVRKMVVEFIESTPMELPITKDSVWWTILMGIEHDRIHLETSSVILRQAEMRFMRKSPVFERCPLGLFDEDPSTSARARVPKNELLDVPAGATRVGRAWDDTKTWGWDNEFGHPQQVDVPAFKASKYLVSNAEFLEFIEAGGYASEKYWSKVGWQWASTSKIKPQRPRFWRESEGKFWLRTLTEEIPMPWDWPAEVNHHEANAFCAYMAEKLGKPIRLPSEAEWFRVRDDEPTDQQESAHGPAWKYAPGNINLEYFGSACPVNIFTSPSGFGDVTGNVWQHSADQIDVLPGFQTHPLYEDFTTPTVDGEHARILGGSFISTGAAGGMRDSRFGFRPHFYQHAGFRYVESDAPVNDVIIPYEQERRLCSHLRFHFQTCPLMEQNFAEELAKVVKDSAEKLLGNSFSSMRTFELGCGPGKTSISLAQLGARESHAADLTAKNFQMVDHFLLNGPNKLRWTDITEGEFVDYTEFQWSDESPANLSWHQVPDFTEIDTTKFNNMDVLVVAQPDALSKCVAPARVLQSLHAPVRPGGLLVLGTTYDWESEASAGKTGEQLTADLLSPWWEPVGTSADLPFALQETARKFNCGTQRVTFWRRREAPQGESQISEAVSSEVATGQAMYEDRHVLSQYLDFHFVDGADGNYPSACAAKCIELCQELKVPTRRALDIGGGPGRSTFELAKVFDHVDGGDYSRAFVDVAQGLSADGELKWTSSDNKTGNTTIERSFSLADAGAADRSVAFHELDAHNLPEKLQGYDLICGFNLIDRLENPAQALKHMKERLNVGGLLVLSSPYTWREEYTPKDNWLGGYKFGDNDGPTTSDGLRQLLEESGFEAVKEPQDLWFTLRTQADGRRYERTCAELSVFKRIA